MFQFLRIFLLCAYGMGKGTNLYTLEFQTDGTKEESDATTLAGHITTSLTDAVLAAVGIRETTILNEAAPGASVNADEYVVFEGRDSTGEKRAFSVGGPRPSIFGETGAGDRVIAATITALNAALVTAGSDFVIERGYKLQEE